MRNTIISTSLAVLIAAGSVGCKSAPKMAWWKSAEKTDVESTALAHTAPTKPSVLAKQAEEGLAAAGGEAAPFVPGVPTIPAASVATAPAATSYPNTEAPSFTLAPAATVASAAPAASANLGSVQMPYDPNAVPPATTIPIETGVPAAASTDRYANASPSTCTSPGMNNPTTNTSVAPATTDSRYGNYLAAIQADAPPATESSPMAPAAVSADQTASNAAATLNDRYAPSVAAATAPAYSPAAPVATAVPQAPTSATTSTSTGTVASATPYRPGGTSSYPSTTSAAPSIEIATRPESPSAQSSGANTQGNYEQAPYPVTPQVPLYR